MLQPVAGVRHQILLFIPIGFLFHWSFVTAADAAARKDFMCFSKIGMLCVGALVVFMSCNDSPTATSQQHPGIIPDIIIQSNSRLDWYRDSLFEHSIYPSTVHCTPGLPCAIISGPRGYDYTCTVFPDTFWGIIKYDFSPSETLFCHSDSAWVRHDTVIYSLENYLDRQANAICSESAIAYTQFGLCYQLSPGETSVRIRNACFDTTVSGVASFCLPKLPLDSLNGVWISSVDTFFCSSAFINTHDDFVTRSQIKSWVP